MNRRQQKMQVNCWRFRLPCRCSSTTRGTSPDGARPGLHSKPLWFSVRKRPPHPSALLGCKGCHEGTQALLPLPPRQRLPDDPTHPPLPAGDGQCQGVPSTHSLGPPTCSVQEGDISSPTSVSPPAIPPCQSLLQNYPEALGESSRQSSRPTFFQQLDQRERI